MSASGVFRVSRTSEDWLLPAGYPSTPKGKPWIAPRSDPPAIWPLIYRDLPRAKVSGRRQGRPLTIPAGWAGYLSKLVDQLARDQLARLQLARVGSIAVQASCAAWISASDQLARLQLARSRSAHDSGVADQLARDQLARDQLARLQLARSGSRASLQLARDQLARV